MGRTVLSVKILTIGFLETKQGSGSEIFYFNLWHNHPAENEFPSNISHTGLKKNNMEYILEVNNSSSDTDGLKLTNQALILF